MFFMKILLARSGVAKYNLVIFWHYWENGHFEQNQVIAQTLSIRNSVFTRHINQHHAIIFFVLQSKTLTLHLGYPSTVRLPYVTIHLWYILPVCLAYSLNSQLKRVIYKYSKRPQTFSSLKYLNRFFHPKN